MKEFLNHSVYVNNNHIELGYAFDTIANYNSVKNSNNYRIWMCMTLSQITIILHCYIMKTL